MRRGPGVESPQVGELTLGGTLAADLGIPLRARGVVVFAHGSGSSRKSPRNRFVAAWLRRAGYATLLLDLLTPEEEKLDLESGGTLRFDIPLLAERLMAASALMARNEDLKALPRAYFGASTGAAAALMAAAEEQETVAAVVSRGGRPDLALDALERVKAPTLLIVGGADGEVLELNRAAWARLRCVKALKIVPGATHLFEEEGALEQVATLAIDWFDQHLARHA